MVAMLAIRRHDAIVHRLLLHRALRCGHSSVLL
jgi:hypothetical protein